MEICQCDPLQKCLEAFFCSLITREFLYFSASRHFHGNKEQDLRKMTVQQIVNDYVDKCINSYQGHVFRPQLNSENMTVTITDENIKRAEDIWLQVKPQFSSETSFEFVLSPEALCPMDPTQFDGFYPAKKIEFDKRNNIQIELKTDIVYKNVVNWNLDNFPRSSHWKRACTVKNINLDVGMTELADDIKNIPLIQYRKILTATCVMKAMVKSGYNVDVSRFNRLPANETFYNQLFLVFSNAQCNAKEDQLDDATVFRLTLGNVHLKNESKNDIRANVTAEYLFNLRYDQVNEVSLSRATSEQKSSSTWSSAVSNLTVATINYDLLFKDPKCDIIFSHNDERERQLFQDKGALLIMYNYARVVSILKIFAENVESEKYPTLPSLNEIDFSCHTKNEVNLLNLLLQWPRTVENTIDLIRQEVNINPLLKLVKELTHRFINFYTAEHVLMKNQTPHNINDMMKRIYLLKAIRNVYEEFFDLVLIDCDSI